MLKFKKGLCLVFAIMTAFTGVGCSVSTETSDVEKTQEVTKSQSKKTEDKVKIEDVEWSVEEGIYADERFALMEYTNNSDYAIKEFDVSYIQKSEVTDEDIESVIQYIQSTFEFSDEDMDYLRKQKFGIHAKSTNLIMPGESIQNVKAAYYQGYIAVKEASHLEMVEPDMATIKFVKDDKLFTEYYDFKSDKYTMDSKIENAYQWPNYNLAEKLPKPDVLVLESSSGSESYIWLEAYGMSLDDYLEYVELCKEAGFVEDVTEFDDYYYADDADGNSISVGYDDRYESTSITISDP